MFWNGLGLQLLDEVNETWYTCLFAFRKKKRLHLFRVACSALVINQACYIEFSSSPWSFVVVFFSLLQALLVTSSPVPHIHLPVFSPYSFCFLPLFWLSLTITTIIIDFVILFVIYLIITILTVVVNVAISFTVKVNQIQQGLFFVPCGFLKC